MHLKKLPLGGLFLLAAALLAAAELRPAGAAQGKFDKLSEADRKAFGERFQKEIWPLLERGGKEGCVGCHIARNTALRFSGDPAKDFRTLVADGFLLKDDPGSLLERIIDTSPKRKMPPDDRPGWSAAEVQVLRQFVNDLHQKNKL